MDTLHYTGQIVEYGTEEFESNRAIETILGDSMYINPHKITTPMVLYHRTAGYHMAGSCAAWADETWGIHLYYNDGSIGGKMFDKRADAFLYWKVLEKQTFENSKE